MLRVDLFDINSVSISMHGQSLTIGQPPLDNGELLYQVTAKVERAHGIPWNLSFQEALFSIGVCEVSI